MTTSELVVICFLLFICVALAFCFAAMVFIVLLEGIVETFLERFYDNHSH